jgi:hypothetical protein
LQVKSVIRCLCLSIRLIGFRWQNSHLE